MSATIMSPFQIPPTYRAYPRNNPGKTFFPNWWILDWSFAEIGQYSTNEPNGMIGPVNGCPKRPKTPFVWSLPIRQEICDVSQIGVAFRGICQPFFIQTWLQQYCRRTFFHSAYCPLSKPICFRSVWCGRAMIPGRDLHKLCRIPRNCQCKWLQDSCRAPGTFASFSGFLVKFCFCTGMIVSTELPPSLVPRLHIDDCFEIHNLHWEFCDLL